MNGDSCVIGVMVEGMWCAVNDGRCQSIGDVQLKCGEWQPDS